MILLTTVSFTGCAQNTSQNDKTDSSKKQVAKEIKYKVTFIELGSVRCIPCQKMQPIMKSIEEKYGDQVKVVFYDVWTDEGKPFADQYNVDAIPTQVFLDKDGKEFFRHVGFFEETELIKVLNTKDVQ
ncbi:MAG: thioredoxin [Bacteroidetes bacterium]|nr:MAG: thioredoxin [Bacteroidota bacterium]